MINLRGHQLCFSTIWTNNLLWISDKSFANQWRITQTTNEAIIVPVTVFKWDESCATNTLKRKSQFNDHYKFTTIMVNLLLPVIGLVHAVQRLAKSSPKQSAQYGFSSRDVKRWPANDIWQLLHVKHSRCHGSFL